MSEADVIAKTPRPWTIRTLAAALQEIGVQPGMTLLCQMAMSPLGWVAGGPVAVIQALLAALGPEGTLLMATHSAGNTAPEHWQNPPVPADWIEIIHDETPAYDPALTPTRCMGRVPELFRTWPGVLRSSHPAFSMAAFGPNATYLTADHDLGDDIGKQSPIGKLYALDGHVLLLGVRHGNNSSLHLAEHRAEYPGKRYITQGSAMQVDGERRWVTYRSLDVYGDDFETIGAAFEADENVTVQRIGGAEARLFRQRALVDFATAWMEEHRDLHGRDKEEAT